MSAAATDDVTITWLAMTAPPRGPAPARPQGALDLVTAKDPPVGYFLYLYRTVGGAHDWTDWLERSPAEQAAFVGDPQVSLHTLMVDGWPGGFFMLDRREPGTCDLAYFGLAPEAIGRRLGRWFLDTAVRAAWDRPGTRRVTVNTCTLDHPRALGLYRAAGFEPVASRTLRRRTPRDAGVGTAQPRSIGGRS